MSLTPRPLPSHAPAAAAPQDAASFSAAVAAACEAGGTDVLLTHSSCSSSAVAGLNVKVHAWGHIHNRFGARVVADSWLDVCACSLDGDYRHTHGAVAVDIPTADAPR